MSSIFRLRSLPLAALALATFSACAPRAPASEPSEKAPAPVGLARILPLEDRTVSSFETESDLGDQGILIVEIYRPRQELAELKIAGSVQRLEIDQERITQASGGIILELPLKKGHSFRGPFGTVTIEAVGHTVTVPAGTFHGCVLTIEESVTPPKRAESTYCPDIGLTTLVIETFGAESARLEARLKHHGPRVDLVKQR